MKNKKEESGVREPTVTDHRDQTKNRPQQQKKLGGTRAFGGRTRKKTRDMLRREGNGKGGKGKEEGG